MGMDVYGKNPRSEAGKYFRNSVWTWRPLANYILDVAPLSITNKCEHWHTNDGDGLNDEDSQYVAGFLQAKINLGETAKYEADYKAEQASLPRVKCEICEGTGIRSDDIGRKGGWPEKIAGTSEPDAPNPRKGQIGSCNNCDGWGTTKDWLTAYPFSVENVQNFVNFLKDCGGFEIC